MTFKDYRYERIDIEEIRKQFKILVEEFKNADSFETQDKVMTKINEISNNFETMTNLVHIRHTVNTNDKFYDEENEYCDEITPIFQGLGTEYYKALIKSKFKDELKKKWGEQIFTLAEMQMKTFSEEVLKDLQEENKLSSQYSKLVASAKIEFDGEIRNLSQLTPYMQSKDRQVRKEAHEKSSDFFVENEEKFDGIYDKLVKVRHRIATKLGFENFIELAYLRMARSEYGSKEVEVYRKQVLENIVPLAVKLRERQAKRLGLDSLKYYDEPLIYTTGNALPKGDRDWMVKQAQKMYSELSKETDEFFTYMVNNELLDLDSKQGKEPGGYCTYIPNYKSPFIYANFNGTSGDVDVLTHEAGHAFQVYSSRKYKLPEYFWPTYEACEIHSMSMEFITWPWMNLFFKEDELKFKFAHLSGSLLFIPYGVTVDEFQHEVYKNPEMTPAERKAKWAEIEKKYLPTKDYEDNDFLKRGGFWFKQGHIFNMPFYYIDDTLAQVCAHQFWIKFRENKEEAWKEYKKLCEMGGSQPFLKLLELTNLKNPFKDGTIEYVTKPIEKWLNEIDDSIL